MSPNIESNNPDQKLVDIFLNAHNESPLLIAKIKKEIKFIDDELVLQIKTVIDNSKLNLPHNKVIKNRAKIVVLDKGNREKKNILAMPADVKLALEQMKSRIEAEQGRVIKIKVKFIIEERNIVKNENNEDVVQKRVVKEEILDDVVLISHEDSDNSYSKAIAGLVSNVKFQFTLLYENDKKSTSEIGHNVESKNIKLSGMQIPASKDPSSTLIESPLGKKALLAVLANLKEKQDKTVEKAKEETDIEEKDTVDRTKAKREKAKEEKVEKINKQDENTELRHAENLKFDNKLLDNNQTERGRQGNAS